MNPEKRSAFVSPPTLPTKSAYLMDPTGGKSRLVKAKP